jgi:hypothetical protein
MAQLSKEEITKEAIEIVKGEVSEYEDPQFFVTEKVSFAIRPLIRKLRKNYWGIFDGSPIDPVTKKQKTWVPYTAVIVDNVRKNVDIDLKDVDFASRNGREGIPVTSIVRGFTRDWCYRTNFGEDINNLITALSIDGTEVWKTYTIRKGKKTHIKRRRVDILNCYIDPTANSIQEAPRFTERALMRPDEIAQMDWMNKDEIKTKNNLSKIEKNDLTTVRTGDYSDVYDMWGLVPEYLFTGNKEDTDLVEANVVISGIETGDLRLHKLERNTTKDKEGNIIKPYEEAWFLKLANCWYGVSPAWKVIGMQEYLNEIVNLRRKQNTAASLGLFKVKKSAGLTQQAFSNLVAQGVIQVSNMDDLENFAIQGAGEHSYKDEEIAKSWGFEATATLDVSRGASMPATSTATSAVIEDRNAASASLLIRESIGLFLQRYFDRHVLVHIPTLMKQEGICRVHGDFDNIRQIRERVVSYLATEMLDEMWTKEKRVPSEQEFLQMMDAADRRLTEDGDLFFDVVDEIVTQGIDTKVRFTNEEMDVAVTVNNLLQMLQIVPPEVQRDLVSEVMDLMGLEVPASLNGDKGVQAFQAAAQGATPGAAPAPTLPADLQGLTTDANTAAATAYAQ